MGLGVTIGSPVGFAGAYDFGSGALAWSIGGWGGDYYGGYLDYVVRPAQLANGDYGAVSVVIGGGVALGTDLALYDNNFNNGRGNFGFGAQLATVSPYNVATPTDFAMDVHGTLGIELLFPNTPVDVFAHFSPGLLIIPNFGIGSRFVLGSRWYF